MAYIYTHTQHRAMIQRNLTVLRIVQGTVRTHVAVYIRMYSHTSNAFFKSVMFITIPVSGSTCSQHVQRNNSIAVSSKKNRITYLSSQSDFHCMLKGQRSNQTRSTQLLLSWLTDVVMTMAVLTKTLPIQPSVLFVTQLGAVGRWGICMF